ncbi:MAG: glycosyltransferase family 2 protein [Clostridia bacterium]|nr:glycosyltransferase family 2 protein [Clostridia bacterium]
MKKVSVVIPMHNSSKHIEECIDSVINQTYKNIEIIVVDDKSSDNSISIVKNKNDDRIKLIELKENVGAAKARNKGIENAPGDYICFLDSDDYWKEDKLEKQVKFMEGNDYTFVYGGYAYLKKGRMRTAHVPKSMNYKQLLKNHAIFTSTVMLNMEHLKKEQIYMPDIKRGQDMATWWHILKNGITAYGIAEVISIYRVGEKSLSSNKFKAVRRTWNLFKTEDINIFKRIYLFFCYIFNAIKRRMSL